MQQINSEMDNVGRVNPDQRKLQQAQMQMQQMAQQMAQLQAQLIAQQHVERTYTLDQTRILMACETINQVMEEFDLSNTKKSRLLMAKNYLLILGDLREFLPQEQQTQPQYNQDQNEDDEQFTEDEQALPYDPDNTEPPTPERTTVEEIEEIQRKMENLKREEAIETKEKSKTGTEKIKDFINTIGKKGAIEPKSDHADLSESMG